MPPLEVAVLSRLYMSLNYTQAYEQLWINAFSVALNGNCEVAEYRYQLFQTMDGFVARRILKPEARWGARSSQRFNEAGTAPGATRSRAE